MKYRLFPLPLGRKSLQVPVKRTTSVLLTLQFIGRQNVKKNASATNTMSFIPKQVIKELQAG